MITYSFNSLTPSIYYDIFLKTINEQPPSNILLEQAINNSLINIVAYDNNVPIAMGRVVGDGIIYFYLQDICVIPTYQNRGIGKQIVTRIISQIYARLNTYNNPKITLISAKDKEPFYSKLGFVSFPNNNLGSGMRYIKQ